MRGRSIVGVLVAASLLVGAHAVARKRAPKRKVATVKASGPASIKLESVDGRTGEAIVVVTGISREPDARFFTFRTVDDRRFIALDSHCAVDEAALRCKLVLPRPYLRFEIVGLELHVRGRDVVGDPAELKPLFAAARADARTTTLVDGGAGDGMWEPSRPDGGIAEEREDETDADTEEWRALKKEKAK